MQTGRAESLAPRCKVARLTPLQHEFPASGREKLLGVAAFLAAGVMLFWGLGSLALMQPDEGRNAEVAREMAVSGSWLVPTLEGHPYLDKPAAYFAAVALSLKAFGVNEWGARVPSAICGTLILALLYRFLRSRYDAATAALAVIVVATSPMMFTFSRIVIMDIMLALCTVAAILAAFVAEDREIPDRRWHAAGAAAAGCGMLVKGPVGALVPAAVLAAFFWWDGRARALRRVFAPWNVLIVLGLFLPWFAALVYVHPEFAHYGVVEETLGRFFTPAFNRGQPFWYYGPVLVVTFFPWIVLLLPIAASAWPARSALTRADRLFVAWAIVVVVFFSLSRTKQPGYILTGVIAAGVCIGRALGHAWRIRDGRAARWIAGGSYAFAAMALAAGAVLGIAVARGAADADRLTAMAPRVRAVWSMWPVFLIVLAAIATLGALAGAWRSAGLAAAAFALFPIALVTIALPALEEYALSRSAKALALQLASLPPGTEIACLDSYPPGLSFYLGRTVTIISEDATPLRSNFLLYWMKHAPARPATLVAPSGRDAWLTSRETEAYVVAPDGARADLERWLGSSGPVRAVASGWWGASLPLRAER
jgi:4-amino-4-deoxy-L-arabinose transferase-like glycosyltransferase